MANEIMGVDVLIYADGKKIAGQRDCTISINGDSIDTTCKDNGSWKTAAVGLLGWSISLTAIEFSGQSGKEQAVFEKAMLTRTPLQIKAIQAGKKVVTGTGIITSKETSGSYSDVSTGSYEIAGNSALETAFVPYIESAKFTGTSLTVKLTENVSAVDGVTLANAVKVEDSTVSAATIGTDTAANTITITLAEAPTAGKLLTIAGGSIKNGEAVQAGVLSIAIEAA